MLICSLDARGYCDRHKRVHTGQEREFALDESPIGNAHRREWDRQMGNEPPPRPPCRFLDDSTVLDRRNCNCPTKWLYACEIYGGCTTREQPFSPHQSCDRCPHYQALDDQPDRPTPESLILANHQSPGDGLVMSAAIESLHRAYPDAYITDVECSANPCYEGNPLVRRLEGEARGAARRIVMEYPAIHRSDDRAIHFMQAFCEFLAEQIRRPVPLAVANPIIHLSTEEKGWLNQVEQQFGYAGPYWVINAGRKNDFTTKYWGEANYQALADRLASRVVFVQIGESNHHHPALRGVFDLRGKTDQRQLVRLCYHARAGVGPTTFLQHIMAAFRRPYVCILGGREPVTWVQYPLQQTLHTLGAMDCCRERACWKSRTVALGDGEASDKSLCRRPLPLPEPIPACMGAITVDEVANTILRSLA